MSRGVDLIRWPSFVTGLRATSRRFSVLSGPTRGFEGRIAGVQHLRLPSSVKVFGVGQQAARFAILSHRVVPASGKILDMPHAVDGYYPQ